MSVELTNCCGAFPTWGDNGMFCKKCFRSVGPADLHEQATIDVPPKAENALTFDEAEAAGLDGTLRTVGDAWVDDEEYPSMDWRYEVANEDTRRGYWEWVAAKREEET